MNLKIWLTLSLLTASITGMADDRFIGEINEHAVNAEVNNKDEKRLAQSHTNSQTDQGQLRAEAQQIIQQFAGSLKKALVTAIQSGGLVHAVDVCYSTAPDLAKDLSKDGWRVARTSLKTRNTQNQPDDWEAKMLDSFDSQFKAGVNVKELNISLYDQQRFRYMQAIPTDKVCLACHGVSIDAALNDAIMKQYPNDRATGFSLEDIRGAFTLSKALED
jgi:hypothetical protein